jgi:hypothetical protein
MQFYFLGSARFMMDIGIPAKNVPASMAIAQAVQAAATFFLLGWLISGVGFKWTLAIGAACWLVLYVIYVISTSRLVIIVAQSLHGLAYVLFIIAGQVYASSAASPEILKSMQALVFAATTGLGLFCGTQFAGFIMDIYKREGKFNWRAVFLAPAAIILVSIVVLIALFKG